MQEDSSWDRNPPNFTLDLVSYLLAMGDLSQLRNYNALCINFRLFTCCATGYRSDIYIHWITMERSRYTLLMRPKKVETVVQCFFILDAVLAVFSDHGNSVYNI